MKKAMAATMASALLLSALVHPLTANEESAADFFRKDKEYWSKGLVAPSTPSWAGSLSVGAMRPSKNSSQEEVARAVAEAARKTLGAEHVDSALRLTKLESGFRCHVKGPATRHGRAVGPLQVLPKSAEALGISAADLHRDCIAQINAGILHMERCIRVGAVKYHQLASCHVSGWGGWNKRLARNAEKYRQKYIRMAAASNVPAWAGTLR